MDKGIRRRVFLGLGLALLPLGIFLARHKLRRFFFGILRRWRGNKSVTERLNEYGPAVRDRLSPKFAAAGVPYPPSRILLAAFKLEKRLELYASDSDDRLRFIESYPVFGASGDLGPKLREGDHQVPEGAYVVDSLNPNSLFHLSLHVSYPSDFDRKMALDDGRNNLGGDIMIHGGSASVGCLALGDDAIEELFVLSAIVRLGRIAVLISPVDFRNRSIPTAVQLPAWSEQLYAPLRLAIQQLPLPKSDAAHQ